MYLDLLLWDQFSSLWNHCPAPTKLNCFPSVSFSINFSSFFYFLSPISYIKMRTSLSQSFFGTVFSNIFKTKVHLHILLYNRITPKNGAFLSSGGITEFLPAGLNRVGSEGERLRHKTVATKRWSGIVIFAFFAFRDCKRDPTHQKQC